MDTQMIEDQIKVAFMKLTHARHYDKWLDTSVACFGLKTPQQMISDGKGEEVLQMLFKLIKGGYIDS